MAQPHWMPPMMNPLPSAAPTNSLPAASSSLASMVQVKPAPLHRNPSMASAPSTMSMDPWAEAKMKQQR